ncbi:MAG: hypothetical protein WEA56_12450 [Balneolaceae bacterium]
MVSEKTISDLINRNGNNLITITLPTHKVGEQSKQDPIRFKNLLNEVEAHLKEQKIKETEIEKILEKPRELLDKPIFWSHVDKGLAVYISEDLFEVYKLPYEVDQYVYINSHFLITPLLPMTSMDGTFCVLTVSRQKVRLLRCTRNEVIDMTPADAPKSVEDYLEVDPEKELQFHTNARGQEALFFGHNANEEDKMVVVEQFLRELEKEITHQMRDLNDPLMMIGLKDNIVFYKKINNYERMIDSHIETNPDELSDKEIKDKGWGVVQKYFLKDMYHSLETFSENNEKVSNNLSEIVEATVMGKSQTIFISKDEKKWGLYDPEEHTVHYASHPNGENVELLNWLSIKARQTGSKVYILPKEEMPLHSTVAAEYRF